MKTINRFFGTLLSAVLFVSAAVAGPDRPGAAAAPAAYEVDVAHSEITFSVRHLGISTVTGTFETFEADLTMDPADPTSMRAAARIDAASIDTDNEKRDEHLRSGDFFETEAYPSITFESREVRNVEGNTFEIVGDLTIRDVTKPIVLQTEMRGPAELMGKQRVGFTATGVINRTDYGLAWNRVMEAGSLLVGEEVKFTIEVAAVGAETAASD